MKRWAFVLSLALVATPALAQDRGKDKDKKDAKKPTVATAEVLIAEAEAKAAAGDADGAAESLRKAAAMPSPAAGDASLRLGRLLESRFEMDNAIDAYRAAAEKLAGAAKGEALGRLAIAQDLRGGAEVAASAEAAVAADASGVWPTIALARARAQAGKADEAIALAQKAASAGGDAGAGAAAQAALGLAQETKGDLAVAESAYNAGLAADAKSAAATLGLARVLRKTGRAAEAAPLLAAVITSAPGAVEAYKESARVKIALGRPQDAMGDAATAAAMAENDKEAQALVQEVTVATALGLASQGQVDMAIQDLTALRDKNPDLAAARLGLGKALVIKRQPDAALVELKKAVELDPKNAEAWYQMGYASYALKQDAAGALPSFEKAVAADPSNLGYRTFLGAVLGDTGQGDRAVEELTKVTSAPGYNKADAWIYLGSAHLSAKRYKDAIEALNKAVAIAPQAAVAEAYLGWSYLGLKDAAGFKDHAGKARTLGWKDAQLLDRLKRVEAGEVIK